MGTRGVIVADLSILEAREGERGERWAEAALSDDRGGRGPGPQLSVVDVPDDGSPGFNKPRLAGWAVVTSGQPPSLSWHLATLEQLLASNVLLINITQPRVFMSRRWPAKSESWS